MTLSVNWATGVIDSTASILDLPAFHAALRDLEDDPAGMIWPATHKWKALDLGSGAFMYQADLINGYTLRFPSAGNYTITGNLNATIVPVAGVYVERKTATAFTTTAVGGGGSLTGDQDSRLTRIEKLLRNKQITNPATGTMTVFDDDGATPLLSGPLYEDAAGGQPYRGQGAERRERLA